MLTPIHPAAVEHIEPLIAVLSSADRTELSTLSQGQPADMLSAALAASTYSFCYLLDGEPVAMGGLTQGSLVWMVASTPKIAHHKIAFLKASRAELASIRAIATLAGWDKLVAVVDERWRKSLRWLDWLGFLALPQKVDFKGRVGVCMVLRP